MKMLLQEFLLSSFSLFLTSNIFSGLIIKGGITSYIIGGIILTIGEYIIKPIIKIITLPFTMITFGIFSFFINAIVLFIVSKFYDDIKIISFFFNGFEYNGIKIPPIQIQILLSYVIISATIYLIRKIIHWIFI